MTQRSLFAGGFSPGAFAAGIGGIVLIVGAVVFIIFPQSSDRLQGSLCARDYATARSAADSTVIDARTQPLNRSRAGNAARPLTCGELRRQGLVR